MNDYKNIITLLIGVFIFSIPAVILSYFIFRYKLKRIKEIVIKEVQSDALNEIRDEIELLINRKENVDVEINGAINELSYIQEKIVQAKNEYENFNKLLSDYEKKIEPYKEEISIQERVLLEKNKLKRLMKEVMKYEDIIELQEFGVYKPSFNFDTSEEYKQKISDIREKLSSLIKEGKAGRCYNQWTVDGSRSKGIAMERDAIKLAIRSFNNECDSIITKVNFRNIYQSIERINKSFNQLNNLNKRNAISLSQRFLDLKIDEAKLTYEYTVKKEEEREEQRRIKEEMREEIKAQKELEKAKIEAERKQKEYEKELEYTRKLLIKDQKNTKLKEKLQQLEEQLKEAIERGQRAISQAQLTKSGHVYVISNIGSFGQDVFKIGMTRRLEPLDRIRELGDASVPFSFDVHAMIYSENAPALEYELHKAFINKQINKVNPRKEFFKVSLAEIKAKAEKLGAEVEFTMVAEAREFYESQALEKENQQGKIARLDDIDNIINNI
uniref:DUF4041 domain-containing protein n=1 Tax=Pasteurella multocida TaxID=747 RepID=UPI003F6C75E5